MSYIIGLLLIFGVFGWIISGQIVRRQDEKKK